MTCLNTSKKTVFFLYICQVLFREIRVSNNLYLSSITHEIYKSFDCSPCLEVQSVVLNISKAFDKVWHVGLLYKFKSNGESYFSRCQRLVLNGQTFKFNKIKVWVPQGSILGPLLFLIYINVPSELCRSPKLFADDTSLFSVVEDVSETANKLNILRISTNGLISGRCLLILTQQKKVQFSTKKL